MSDTQVKGKLVPGVLAVVKLVLDEEQPENVSRKEVKEKTLQSISENFGFILDTHHQM